MINKIGAITTDTNGIRYSVFSGFSNTSFSLVSSDFFENIFSVFSLTLSNSSLISFNKLVYLSSE